MSHPNDEPFGRNSPNDKETRDAIRELVNSDKWYRRKAGKSAHPLGWLHCVAENPCQIVVYSTPKGNQARAIWNAAWKCPHGYAPKSRWPNIKMGF